MSQALTLEPGQRPLTQLARVWALEAASRAGAGPEPRRGAGHVWVTPWGSQPRLRRALL